jgi:uncharacterized protein (DUF1697 family)
LSDTIGAVITYAVLLRGVNVGGNNRVPMADLRACLQSLGGIQVSTYLQSGNAVVTTALSRQDLCRGVADRFGVAVVARTHTELTAVVDANPFLDAAAAPTTLHVAFLAGQPEPERFAALDAETFLPDELRLGDQALYLHSLPERGGPFEALGGGAGPARRRRDRAELEHRPRAAAPDRRAGCWLAVLTKDVVDGARRACLITKKTSG